jgi:hypothetical protein
VSRIVLSFATIHDALAAEKAAVGMGGIELVELLPLPPSIKSDCGFGLFLTTIGCDSESIAALRAEMLLFEAAYSVREIAGIAPGRKEKVYERIDEAH